MLNLLAIIKQDFDLRVTITPEILALLESGINLEIADGQAEIEADDHALTARKSFIAKKVMLQLNGKTNFTAKITWDDNTETTATGGSYVIISNALRIAGRPVFTAKERISQKDCLFIRQTVNHYKWLNLHLDQYWKAVTGKTLRESYAESIVLAHGSCYEYADKFLEANIPHAWGMAIYLSSYKLLSSRRNINIVDWIINQYKTTKKHLAPIDFNEDIISITYMPID